MIYTLISVLETYREIRCGHKSRLHSTSTQHLFTTVVPMTFFFDARKRNLRNLWEAAGGLKKYQSSIREINKEVGNDGSWLLAGISGICAIKANERQRKVAKMHGNSDPAIIKGLKGW